MTEMQIAIDEARRAYDRLPPRLRLDARDALGLAFLALQWGQYAALLVARGRWPEDGAIVAALEDARQALRRGAADFGLLRPGRGLAAVGPSGADLELRRTFTRLRATAGSLNKRFATTGPFGGACDGPISRHTRRRR